MMLLRLFHNGVLLGVLTLHATPTKQLLAGFVQDLERTQELHSVYNRSKKKLQRVIWKRDSDALLAGGSATPTPAVARQAAALVEQAHQLDIDNAQSIAQLSRLASMRPVRRSCCVCVCGCNNGSLTRCLCPDRHAAHASGLAMMMVMVMVMMLVVIALLMTTLVTKTRTALALRLVVVRLVVRLAAVRLAPQRVVARRGRRMVAMWAMSSSGCEMR